jgi:hypothetical protein
MDAGWRLCAFSADPHRYSATIGTLLLLDFSPMAATPRKITALHCPNINRRTLLKLGAVVSSPSASAFPLSSSRFEGAKQKGGSAVCAT